MTRYVPAALCGFVLLSCSLAWAQSTIQGVVKDNVGNGMENVHVQITFSGATRTATTDSEGRYAIPGVPAGICTVTFEADRYVTIKRQVTAPANGSVSVDANMSPEETVGVRELEPRYAQSNLPQLSPSPR
ncbi:MAG TPA: carboxypeptidase-like regulatory domain-containing protein [Bryobacteraceae bacterium]|nr:carboxypeptidase-like regulatory domain-containing protein [Bryobacteraceae bacterium]